MARRPIALTALSAVAAAVLAAGPARAEGDSMRYEEPQDPHYFRSIFEILAINVIGNVDYLLNTTDRGGTAHPGDRLWDLRYDWPTFHDKLTGELWRKDSNQFNTNYIAHPMAGALYYTAARSNHLTWLESFAFSTLGSFAWEYFAEMREVVSLNDAIVTPAAGFAIGETTMQLGDFFSRSSATIPNRVVAALFAPLRAINDLADGGRPRRDGDYDHLGLTRGPWHRFEVGAGARMMVQRGLVRPERTVYAAPRVALDARVVNIPGYGSAGQGLRLFEDGNVSRLQFDLSWMGGRVADATFSTKVVPVGVFYHDAPTIAHDGLRGSEAIFGYMATFEYSAHDYDRDGGRPVDVYSIASPLGIYGEYTYRRGRAWIRPEIEVSANFAGITSYGLGAYRASRGLDVNIPSVLAEKAYYHGYGATAAGGVTLGYGPVEIGSRARVDTVRTIEGFDEKPRATLTNVDDRRVVSSGWCRVSVPGTGWSVRVDAEARQREGTVGQGRAAKGEVALMGMTSWRF